MTAVLEPIDLLEDFSPEFRADMASYVTAVLQRPGIATRLKEDLEFRKAFRVLVGVAAGIPQ